MSARDEILQARGIGDCVSVRGIVEDAPCGRPCSTVAREVARQRAQFLLGVTAVYGNGIAVFIQYVYIERKSFIGAVSFYEQVKIAVRHRFARLGTYDEIADILALRGVDINIAEDARHAPHILAFQPAARAPAVYFHADHV